MWKALWHLNGWDFKALSFHRDEWCQMAQEQALKGFRLQPMETQLTCTLQNFILSSHCVFGGLLSENGLEVQDPTWNFLLTLIPLPGLWIPQTFYSVLNTDSSQAHRKNNLNAIKRLEWHTSTDVGNGVLVHRSPCGDVRLKNLFILQVQVYLLTNYCDLSVTWWTGAWGQEGG